MYELIIKTQFSAAHRLRNYRGKCENLHGHNWEVEIILSGKSPGRDGMVIDFHEAKQIVDKFLSRLDHQHLNAIRKFKKLNPTTENIARVIAQGLARPFSRHEIRIARVGVWESPQCGAYYYAV